MKDAGIGDDFFIPAVWDYGAVHFQCVYEPVAAVYGGGFVWPAGAGVDVRRKGTDFV